MEEKLPFEREERKIVVKKEASTNPEWGCKPEDRPVEELLKYGIINLNKPSGPTSHQVADYVQKILNLKKSGHSGTLDPKVTGVLPIAIDDATRIVQALLPAGKEYIALMRIHAEVPEKEVLAVFKQFQGKIMQLPPVRSAVKRQLREREVYYMNIIDMEGNFVLFKVGCEAGTYIRKLIHDMGRQLKVGAHMAQLIRTKAGPFTDQTWVTLQDVTDAYAFWKQGSEKEIRKVIQPFEKAVDHVKKVWIFDNAVNNVCHGSSLGVQGISKLHSNIEAGDQIAIMTLKDELVALSKAALNAQAMQTKDKGLAAITEKVFLPRNIYTTNK
ncbi:RNA-guided pseudouridylation complex pseudouridine synthase subunit Cbf5 [Candidatus Woesearchaeota archaeon]|nr:RNA-guided pseudouridylation complex pseudouridine synthase subunit Cbf5 [Candidatus Woesearchaeota archaeon]